MTNRRDERRRFLQATAAGAGSLAFFSFVEACKSAGVNPDRSGLSAAGGGVRTRKSWDSMSPAERGLYEQAVKFLNDEPISGKPYASQYQRIAYVHQNSCPHGNWFFLPWHRAYLSYYESELVRVLKKNNVAGADNFALPYWDWTKNPKVPQEFQNTTLDPVMLYQANKKIARARFPDRSGTKSLPYKPMPAEAVGPDAFQRVMQTSDFYQFASYPSPNTNFDDGDFRSAGSLEGIPHNNVHGFIGGFMGDFLSPMDPIFWLHHCNVDRIWNLWMSEHSDNLPYTPAKDPRTFANRGTNSREADMAAGLEIGDRSITDYRKYWLSYVYSLDAGQRGRASDVLHKGATAADLLNSATFALKGVENSRPYSYDTDRPSSRGQVGADNGASSQRTVSQVEFKEIAKASSSTTIAAKISIAECQEVLGNFSRAIQAGKPAGAFVILSGLPVPADEEVRNASQVRLRVADADTRSPGTHLRSELGVVSFIHHSQDPNQMGHMVHTATISTEISEWLKANMKQSAGIQNVWISAEYELKAGMTAPERWSEFTGTLKQQLGAATKTINITLTVRA